LCRSIESIFRRDDSAAPLFYRNLKGNRGQALLAVRREGSIGDEY
jgi:hypothetical protein